MTRLCICEICSCGRHRCPHQPTALYDKGGGVCVATEYTEKFPAHGGHSPPKSLKPKQDQQTNRAKMDGTTTFRTDFIPYAVVRRPGRQQAEYKPSPGEIDLGTTYKQDFNPYEIQPMVPARPRERARTVTGKLDTMPTYKDDFRQWEISRRQLTKPDLSYRPPSAKFGNSTTFQDDFIARGLVPRQSFKPPNAAKFSDAPFDAITSNQLAYVSHPLEVRFVKAPVGYKAPSQPLMDLTTHRYDYQGLPGQPPKSCKPDPAKVRSDVPFQRSTEFRDRFQEWPVSLPQFQKKSEYMSPTAAMDLCTTTQTDYTPHSPQPYVAMRPHACSTQPSAPFQGNTTMKEDFQAWVSRRQELIRKPEEIRRSSGKMEDLTTFRAHFVQHPHLQPSPSFKPPNAPLRSERPLEGDTMYRTEFTPKKLDVCPASLASPPGFQFEESDERGHRFYRKLSQERGSQGRGSQERVAVAS